MPTIAIGSSLRIPARAGAGAGALPRTFPSKNSATAAALGWSKTSVAGSPSPVARPSRLRSSTAARESKPRSLKAAWGSIACSEAWPSTIATCFRTSAKTMPWCSAAGAVARRAGSEALAGRRRAGRRTSPESSGARAPSRASERRAALCRRTASGLGSGSARARSKSSRPAAAGSMPAPPRAILARSPSPSRAVSSLSASQPPQPSESSRPGLRLGGAWARASRKALAAA